MLLTHHWSFKISRHIAPVTELMLGCQILVIKRTWRKENVITTFIQSTRTESEFMFWKNMHTFGGLKG